HPDLAGQTRVFAHVIAEIEHVLFHRSWRSDLFAPRIGDIDMAGRAGAGAAALGLDPWDHVPDRRLPDGRSDLCLHRALFAGVFDESNIDHACRRPARARGAKDRTGRAHSYIRSAFAAPERPRYRILLRPRFDAEDAFPDGGGGES